MLMLKKSCAVLLAFGLGSGAMAAQGGRTESNRVERQDEGSSALIKLLGAGLMVAAGEGAMRYMQTPPAVRAVFSLLGGVYGLGWLTNQDGLRKAAARGFSVVAAYGMSSIPVVQSAVTHIPFGFGPALRESGHFASVLTTAAFHRLITDAWNNAVPQDLGEKLVGGDGTL
ncbi:MAG: hypothetical protein HYW48_01970 [Deltaproteobacteria bacterium]|nr:hypothetical protein [Deltaproteobacteria bacterium]